MCDDKAVYMHWLNLKVPVIVRTVEACILRCMWLVHLNSKAELTNKKESCHASKWKVLDKNDRLKTLTFSTDCTNRQCLLGMVCPDQKWLEQTSRK